MQEKSILPIVQKYGLLAGAGMIILSLIGILMTDPSSMSNILMIMAISLIGSAIIYVGISALAIKSQRDEMQDGAISFAEALKVSLLPLLVGLVIVLFFTWVYHNFIDPGYAETLAEGMGEFLENQGIPESQISDQVEEMRNAGSPSTILKSGAIGGVIALVIAAITSAIMKKSPDINV